MTAIVALAGSQTIANVEEAHAQLREALSQSTEIEIDLSAVTEADLAFLQLLLAARRSVEAAGGRMTWAEPSAAIAQAATRSGLAGARMFEATKGEQQ